MYRVGHRDPDGDQTTPGPVEGLGVNAADWVREKLKFEPDAAQARVLAATSKTGLLNCARQWGKSTLTAAMGVHQAFTEAESLTLVVSPSARQSGEFVRKAAQFAQRLGIRPRGDGDNDSSLQFPNGSRIVGLPGNEATVRGFSAVALLLVDEASRVNDELYHAVRPMLAVSDGRLWLMSTPFGKRGFFWEAWSKTTENWMRVEVPATECSRIEKKFLEDERKSMGERRFRQEYLCEFEDSASGVFGRDLVEQAITDDVAPLVL
jgi:phage FluMu gp28-like protein